MGNQQTFQPTWALIKKPQNYPIYPTAGKLQLILETNSKSLYRRFSPYTDYDNTLINGFTKEPFYWTYIDQKDEGLRKLRKYDSTAFPIGSAPIDVIRVSKFLGSGRGIPFLAKQFLLQTNAPYNETRIYNPTSPIIAAGMGLSLGTIRPLRFVDISGLGGIVRSLIGDSIPNAIFGEPKISAPPGTVAGALPDSMVGKGGKGLLRAGTANAAKAHLEKEWVQTGKGVGLNRTFKSVVGGIFKSLFANFIPQRQDSIKVRSDEGAYGLMIGIGPESRFAYRTPRGKVYAFGQMWYGGGKNTRKDGQIPDSYKIFIKYDSNGLRTSEIVYSQEGFEDSIDQLGQVGYTATESTDQEIPGMRYGDNVGTTISDRSEGEYTNSDIMRQYANYADSSQKFPTKRSTSDAIVKDRSNVKNVIAAIKKASEEIYSIDLPDSARVITSDLQSVNGYDRLFKRSERGKSAINYKDGYLQDYHSRGVKVINNDLTSNPKDHSYKLPTAGYFDAINTLEVLDKDRSIPKEKMRLKTWDKWEPYRDDLIALYFYDVVNEKYIPFRAAIKGLTESGNSSWEELPFIGRADKIYSYGGFNRNLTININIHIGSIVELAPTWQRINYLTTLIKPANYTTSTYNTVVNRFMVPPMVMFTLGDLYKDHPVLIDSVVTTIPDDASWETQHQIGGEQWKYLADYMNAPSEILFGQLPRSIDIALGMKLLEKERAMVGGANFGHAPRKDDNEFRWNTDTVPEDGNPTKLHKSFVVNKDRVPIYSDEEYEATSAQYE